MVTLMLSLVTAISLIAAAIMSVVLWRMIREERRRAAARAALLSRAIYDRTADTNDVEPVPFPTGRFPIAAAAGILIVGIVTGFMLIAESGSPVIRRAGGAAAAARTAGAPLELVALEYDREGTGLIVRGIVRNPPAAAAVEGLTAVVLIFSKDGGFVASGRAPVANHLVPPGAESPFVVTIPDAGTVDRYRVSFRTGDRVVPHVDRRGRSRMAQTE